MSVHLYFLTVEHHYFVLNKRLGPKEKALPEWMTDGPTSQFDVMELKGHAEFEEEKKGGFSVSICW